VSIGTLDLEKLSQRGQAGMGSCRLVVGIVSDTKDSQGMGRVKVTIPEYKQFGAPWARVAAPMAGNDRGCYFPVQAEDQVLVALVSNARDITCEAFVLGVLWNGKHRPPADNRQGESDVCVIKDRSGNQIRLSDAEGDKSIEIISGENSIRIDKENNSLTILSNTGDIVISAPNGTIVLDAKTLVAAATDKATLEGGTTDVSGANGLKLHGQTVDIN
jgi:uncharacterized protein involved in type VI secretion and phage assembly